MRRRKTISEVEAQNWDYRKRGMRPMTLREAAEWDRAQKSSDRAKILQIKRKCGGSRT